MKLPKHLIAGTYTKPNLYLCETDKTPIYKLETTDTSGAFRFNSYSELSCSVSRTYSDMITGVQKINPFYNKIEALRLLHLEGFGYFEIQDPEIFSDGIQEVKNITAYSLEYNLSQKYLEHFYINTGEVNSVEVAYAEENGTEIVPVTLYNPLNPKLSLLHLAIEKIYGWSIGHVDSSLKTMSRTFDISRASVYDFLTQDVCEKFNCYIVFDTIENTINVYAEALTTKFIGDGKTTTFVVTAKYDSLSTVSIDTYKTTEYTYNETTGELIFDVAPADGAKIEVVDGSQTKWITDVYVTFDNLAQEVNINYSADDIKTVLTVKGADDLGIEEVNFGLPYVVDLSYYYTVDWMGQDLYDAYTKYLQKCNDCQSQYTSNAKKIIELENYIAYEETKLSLEYSIAEHVNSTTVGTYYVRGGEAPDYYYKEVFLPSEYNANVKHYYSLSGNDITELKVTNLYAAMKTYYDSQDKKDISGFEELKEDFAFMENNTIESLINSLSAATTTDEKDSAIISFLNEMWEQLGLYPLKDYQKTYTGAKDAQSEQGWNDPANENYWKYYPVTLMLSTLEAAISVREETIGGYTQQRNAFLKENTEIKSSISISNNFTNQQLIRLNAFLREDEYTDDNFLITDSDSIDTILKTQKELLECGKIELAKLCEPKLGFSMSMANIYALPEFEPIVWQFQLGNLINVAIRKDYIKRARLLEVNINFDDFSDFSCEFGELTSLKTPSSIHADLLASAMQAGKSVASNASYWNKGADLATSTDLKIQQGLIGATGGLYTSDQSVVIDDSGIRLRKVNEDGTFSPYQAWLTSNNILLSSDGFEEGSIPRMGLGEFTVDGQTFYGILAEAVLSGYIESSTIVGGTINIGDGTFMVDQFGNVTMKASSIEGYVEKDNVISSINQSPEEIAINANKISLAGKNIDLTSDNITIASTNFSVNKDGKISAKNADISGKITASDGAIGGWTIDSDSISGTSGNYKALISKSAIGTSGNVVFGVYDGSAWSCYMDGVGKLYASNADIKGKITATSGSIAGYNIGSGGSYSDALYKRVSGDSADYEVGMKATSGDTDLAFYVKKSTDNWKNSTNTFYIRNNGQLYAQNAIITGEVNSSSGSIGGFEISDQYLRNDITLSGTRYQTFMQAANGSSTTTAFGVRTSTDDGDNWTYQFRVNYDGSAVLRNATITGSSTIASACIPDLSANKITSGTIDASVVTVKNLNANNITTGEISTDILDASVITTGNFSSKTLTTGRLSVTNGGNVGLWTVNSNNYLYAISGDYGVSLSALSVSHGQGGSATWVNIVKAGQNASDKRLKKDIFSFDDKFDNIFDDLKPVHFEYDKDFLGKGIRFGYVAQDVIKSFENVGENIEKYSFIYETEVEDNSTDKYYQLNQTDFIALNTWQIQKLKARVEELENRLSSLES